MKVQHERFPELDKLPPALPVLGLNAAGFLVLAGCSDPEVGSQPPVGKTRKEIMGDGPLNHGPKTKVAKPK